MSTPNTLSQSEPSPKPAADAPPNCAVSTGSAFLRAEADQYEKISTFFGPPENAEEDAHQKSHVRQLRATADEMDRLTEETKFLHDLLGAFEWQRINAMSHEEVKKELLAAGYTQERLDAGLARIRAIIDKAAMREPNNRDDQRRGE